MRELTPALTLSAGRPVVSSLKVAEHFQKRHDHVLRGIRDLINGLPNEFSLPNFGEREYLNVKGQLQPFYELSRDGFTLVVMGFTGAKALAWKLRYIEAFNALEQELVRLAVVSAGRQAGAPKIGDSESDGPMALPEPPECARRLKPSLRERILASALQAARMQGTGTVEEVEALYARFCHLVADRPAQTVRDEAGRAATGWYAVFLSWAEECVTRSKEVKTSSGRLYNHFCRYMHEARPQMLKPSQKEWGREMRARYLREKSNIIYYHVMLHDGAGAVSLSHKWLLDTESEGQEQ